MPVLFYYSRFYFIFREPFLSFSHPAKREMSHQKKLKLSFSTQSDHAALLKAFEVIKVSMGFNRFV